MDEIDSDEELQFLLEDDPVVQGKIQSSLKRQSIEKDAGEVVERNGPISRCRHFSGAPQVFRRRSFIPSVSEQIESDEEEVEMDGKSSMSGFANNPEAVYTSSSNIHSVMLPTPMVAKKIGNEGYAGKNRKSRIPIPVTRTNTSKQREKQLQEEDRLPAGIQQSQPLPMVHIPLETGELTSRQFEKEEMLEAHLDRVDKRLEEVMEKLNISKLGSVSTANNTNVNTHTNSSNSSNSTVKSRGRSKSRSRTPSAVTPIPHSSEISSTYSAVYSSTSNNATTGNTYGGRARSKSRGRLGSYTPVSSHNVVISANTSKPTNSHNTLSRSNSALLRTASNNPLSPVHSTYLSTDNSNTSSQNNTGNSSYSKVHGKADIPSGRKRAHSRVKQQVTMVSSRSMLPPTDV